ncbi:MAG: HAMP domain-containing histidine kinase [Verrucomicrobia bacterium]|nr:HAMP domain-containing histidine kinase [Verrucomicrobiota bacterium]
MFDRLRQSLALRLAAQYAFVFALATALLFGALYWVLGETLVQRERVNVERRAEILATVYELRGVAGVASLSSDPSPELRAFFVRLVNARGELLWSLVPPDWVETQVQLIPLPLFGELRREVRTERIPQNALRDYAIATRSLADGNGLQVGRLTDSRAVLLQPVRRAFLPAGVLALLLSLGLGTLLAWRATRPLRLVSDTARRIIETGDLAARVPDAGARGELAVLVRQLNTLLDKNAAHVRVLRETLDNLAHDLRTPLTRLRGTAELALQDTGDPAEAKAALSDCIEESDRLLHVLEALLDITAAEAGALKLDRDRRDLRTLTERAVDLYREVAEEKRITVTLDQPAPVEAAVDAIRLGQAVNNLVDNALKYTPAGGRVTVAAHQEPGAAIITVSDSGPGVPVAERDAIFRRLYRGDASRSQRGLGLGLSLVKAIVESHGGTVAVDDAPGGGARFTVRLPR